MTIENRNPISYDPFWKTLKESNDTTYTLIKKGVSKATIHRLKHNMPVTTYTICTLCELLNCNVEDVFQCKRENNE